MVKPGGRRAGPGQTGSGRRSPGRGEARPGQTGPGGADPGWAGPSRIQPGLHLQKASGLTSSGISNVFRLRAWPWPCQLAH